MHNYSQSIDLIYAEINFHFQIVIVTLSEKLNHEVMFYYSHPGAN